jgi:hypothetical protein
MDHGEFCRHWRPLWSGRGFASISSAAPGVLDPATQIIMCCAPGVPGPKPTEEPNRCELRVEDDPSAPKAPTHGICRVGWAPIGSMLWAVEF